MTESRYLHGYTSRECDRLTDQANTLSELLHHDTLFAPGSRVLECGCGTGGQTVFLASRNPEARIVSLDVSATSLEQAHRRVETAGHYTPSNFPGRPVEPERDNARLLGAIVVTEKAGYFFKMVGPDKTMTKLKPAFDELIESIEVADK